MTDVDRRSMRILARSTKAAGPNNARIAERLEKAAGSGDRTDYRRAEESFDALPPKERKRIGTHAERQAETEKQLVAARKLQPAPVRPKAPAVDDSLDWKPLIMEHSPATDPAEGEAFNPGRPAAARSAGSSQPGARPSVPKPASPRTVGSPAAASAARSKRAPGAAGRAVADDPEESDRTWDWQRIPEDPVLKATRRKAPADPISELRRQMLGDESKRR